MKVRLLLKAKKDWGTYKVGDTMTLFNRVFDPSAGIAFYPIEKDKWEVVRYDLFTGLEDRNKKEIYGGDIMKSYLQFENSREYPLVLVRWNSHIAGFELESINRNGITPINWYKNFSVVGNVIEDSHLLAR